MAQKRIPGMDVYNGCIPNISGLQYLQIISVDPGITNLAIRIEQRYANKIVPLFFCRITLAKEKKTASAANGIIKQCTALLKSLHSYIANSHLFIIERQVINKMVIRLYQHMLTYIPLVYPNLCVLDVSPLLKTTVLGGAKGAGRPAAKKFCYNMALAILRQGGDTVSIDIIAKDSAKYDLTDTVCQIAAVLRRVYGC